MDIAIQWTRYLMDNMQYSIEYHVWENEHEKNLKKVLKIIRESKYINIKELALQTLDLDNKKRDDIIGTLITCEQIKEEWIENPDPTKEGKIKLYRPI